MSEFLARWGVLSTLVWLGWLLPMAIGQVYRGFRALLDAYVPDTLPMGAGEWAMGQAYVESVELDVIAAPKETDETHAYIPSARTVVLAQETYYKRDPSFWAAAAHEVGHAVTYQRSLVLNVLFSSARLVSRTFAGTGTLLVVVNVLFVSPAIFELAFGLLRVSLAAFVVVLLDEIVASVRGLRMLARDPAVSRRGLGVATGALLAAFGTYVGSYFGQRLLLEQWPLVRATIERNRVYVPDHPLTDGRFAASALLAGFLFVLGAWAMIEAVRPKVDARDDDEVRRISLRRRLLDLTRGLLMIGVVALTWKQPLGDAYVVGCAVGLMGSRRAIDLLTTPGRLVVGAVLWIASRLLLLPVAIVFFVVRRIAPVKDEPHELAETAVITYAEGALEAMELALVTRPPWHERVAAFCRPACQVAFVLVYAARVMHSP